MIESDEILDRLQYIYLVDGAGDVPNVTKYSNGFVFSFATMGRKFRIALDDEYGDIEIEVTSDGDNTRMSHREEHIKNMTDREIAELAWDWVVDFQKVCTLFENNSDNIW